MHDQKTDYKKPDQSTTTDTKLQDNSKKPDNTQPSPDVKKRKDQTP